jgi:predicted GIY-YIG superfamily endonuclease
VKTTNPYHSARYRWRANQKIILYCLTEGGGRIRYFGITQRPANRLKHHLNHLKQDNHGNKKVAWIANCIRKGTAVKMVVLKECASIEEAARLEKRLVAVFKSAFDLVNTAPGGIHAGPRGGVRKAHVWTITVKHRSGLRLHFHSDETENGLTRKPWRIARNVETVMRMLST